MSADIFNTRLDARKRAGMISHGLFMAATIVGIVALTALLYTVIVQSFGLVAVENRVDPATLAVNGVPLDEPAKKVGCVLAAFDAFAWQQARYPKDGNALAMVPMDLMSL